jgi:hypothetical protein
LKRKCPGRIILWLTFAAILLCLPAIPICFFLLPFFSLGKVLRRIGLVVFGLLALACGLLFLIGQLWYSAVLFEGRSYGELLSHKPIGPYEICIYRFNDTGATGDYRYEIRRERNIFPGVAVCLTLDEQYSGFYDNLEIIDVHTIRYRAIDGSNEKTKHISIY